MSVRSVRLSFSAMERSRDSLFLREELRRFSGVWDVFGGEFLRRRRRRRRRARRRRKTRIMAPKAMPILAPSDSPLDLELEAFDVPVALAASVPVLVGGAVGEVVTGSQRVVISVLDAVVDGRITFPPEGKRIVVVAVTEIVTVGVA